MGTFIYDNTPAEFDDRVLAHLEVVVSTKLRRGESFLLSWRNDPLAGGGRDAVWMSANVPVLFNYQGERPADLDTRAVERLLRMAHSPGGVVAPSPEDLRPL
ncbi:ATP-dependent DNA ligase [Pseudoclavibacter sp. AY1F1]|uniref:DUF7882 family protein n=1 Tax=Pseudoclavibacter sp. AY1F1 TaxID=2080583 RepID=UPI000CE759BD|nr:ATP-dependent DNA ligase [Pseudoclavibacter sp. AY1F1]PPF41971.1 ATP-dependent DNA ligase [Pseudoclavibacter sp. AY1F1]